MNIQRDCNNQRNQEEQAQLVPLLEELEEPEQEIQETEQPAQMPKPNRLQNIKRRLSSISKLQYAVIVAAVLVEIIYLSKGVLLVYRYLHRSKVCVNHTIEPAEDDDSLEFERDDRGYNFTVFLCVIISLLRLIEYIPLFTRVWQYLNKTDVNFNCKHCLKWLMPLLTPHYLKWLMVLTLVLILSLSIPAVGLSLENRCGDVKVTADVFIAYCIINFFRYAWAFSVRMGMVIATLKVNKIWNAALTEIKNANEANIEPHANEANIEPHANEVNIAPHAEANIAPHANEANIASLHAKLTNIYIKAGKQVKKIAKIFETWFLFPWIIFFLVSSLKAKNILSLWNDNEESVELLPLVYFMLYNINQMIFLIIPYLCAKKMNHDHHKCVLKIQKKQLNTEKGDKFVAEQRKLLIQMNEKYDVEPHLWGLGFKVKMNSFMYTLFLLLGLVFTILTPLLY